MLKYSLSSLSVPALVTACLSVCIGCSDNPPPVIPPPVTPPPTFSASYYVDGAHGSDSNSGSAQAPFAHIQACAAVATASQSCAVHAGVYTETVVPKNDGITILPYPGETAVLSAADPVTGWTPAGNGVYTAHVAINATVPIKLQNWPGNQLFYNGIAVPEAQWPAPSTDRLHPNWATIATNTPETATANKTTTVIPATITAQGVPGFTPSRATIHIWSGSDPYAQYAGVPSAGPGGSVTYLADDIFETNYAQPGGLFYITGAPEFLTANTWTYDAASSTLTWQPPVGVDPNSADVRIKQRPVAIDLSGRSNVTVQGIGILGAGVLMDASSKNNTLDGIMANWLSNEKHPHSVAPSSNADLYGFGIFLNGTGNTLKNSVIANSSLSGVTVFGTGNTVTNTLIHDVGSFGDGAAGIFVGDSASSSANIGITHNTIYNSGHFAVFLGTNQSPTIATSVTGVEIANNNLFNTELLGTDGGAIYACCKAQLTGTNVHDNWVHGEVSPKSITFPGGTTPHAFAGVYFDNGDGGLQINNNLVWNSFPEIFLHGGNAGDPTNNFATANVTISNNTMPDAASNCNLYVSNTIGASNIVLAHNQGYFAPAAMTNPVNALTLTDNTPTSAGASSVATPGCTLSGCNMGNPPPAFPAGAPATGATPDCKTGPLGP